MSITKLILAWALAILVESSSGQDLGFPSDINDRAILVYLIQSDELIASMTEEYERVNTKEACAERAALVRNTPVLNNRLNFGDTYGIMFDLTIMDWLNEMIEKASTQRKDKDLILVNRYSLKTYDINPYKYVLKYKFLMDKNFPPNFQLVFYLHDRAFGKDLLDHVSPQKELTFIPVFAYAMKGDPFYGTIRRFKVKREINIFLTKTL